MWNTAVPDNCPSSWSQRARGRLPPVTQSSHHVTCVPTLDRGASPGSPRCPHSIQNGPAGVSRRARLRRASENPRRATDPDDRPSGPSAPHHAAPPAHGPPETSSDSTPHLPSNVHAQGPPKLHARLSPPGRNSSGSGAPLQRPLPGPLMEPEDDETPCARQAHHRVDRQG
jgi:hypothetical protein